MIKKMTKEKVWDIFSKYIRLKYADKNEMDTCYTCGVKKPIKEMQAGHGVSGRGNSILFDERIVRPQCPRCNGFLHGNYDVFHAKLIKEYGKNFLDEMVRQKHIVIKFTQEQYEIMYVHYQEEIDKLKEEK